MPMSCRHCFGPSAATRPTSTACAGAESNSHCGGVAPVCASRLRQFVRL
jgi:hypothetical protein